MRILFVAIGWKYALQINEGILALQENGKLTQLQKKWWEERRGGGACDVRCRFNRLKFLIFLRRTI